MAVSKKDVTIFVLSDINDVKAKLIFGLTKRQLASFLVAGAVGFYTFFMARKLGATSSVALLLLMLVAGIVFFVFHFTIHELLLRVAIISQYRCLQARLLKALRWNLLLMSRQLAVCSNY